MDSNGQGGYYEQQQPQQDSSYMYEPEPEAAPPPQNSRRSSQVQSEQVRVLAECITNFITTSMYHIHITRAEQGNIPFESLFLIRN